MASWPGTLPAFVLSAGYEEQFGQQVLETPMEGGATKTRRRFTRRFDTFRCRMVLSATQQATFDTFYYTTLSGGSQPFDWVHPRLQTAMTFKFRAPAPKITDLNGVDMIYEFMLERQS